MIHSERNEEIEPKEDKSQSPDEESTTDNYNLGDTDSPQYKSQSDEKIDNEWNRTNFHY